MQKTTTRTSHRSAVVPVEAHNYHQKKPKKKLSSCIIVATRNRLPDMLTFLDSIVAQTVQPDELIVVDSSDKKLIDDERFTKKFSTDFYSDTKLIYKHTSPGLTYQRNIGVAFASAPVVYFFDDDTVLERTYIEKMNKAFKENQDCAGGMGSVGGVAPNKTTIDSVIRKIFLLQRDHASGNFTLSGMPTHPYGTTTFKKVQVLGGCCMAYRLWVFKEQLFDEKLARYCYMEDCDFSRRVSYTYPLFFNPHAKLEHRHSPLARDKIQDNRAMYIKNYSYLFFKNFYPHNKIKIFAYWWSVLGLFVQAIIIRDKAYIRGYLKGLYQYYTGR